MDRFTQEEKLRGINAEFLKAQRIELVDLIYRSEGRDLFLKVLADLPEGGISLGECARLNNEIGLMLDDLAILEARYILEVSSPGLDRPLKTKNDFSRCKNRKVRAYLAEAINGRLEWEGIVSEALEAIVRIDAGGTIIEIPLAKINKAKQVID